jgi:hypothetical protein
MANGTLAASQIEMLSQSGTGITTITPPATNTNRAITLPDAAGEVVLNSATQTLTNKTLTTPNIDSAQFATVSGTAPLYACRAWVNFNGTGTVAIRASGNVSSITDNGTGNYTVNFTTAMPDANYAIHTQANPVNSSGMSHPTGTPTVSAVQLLTYTSTSLADLTIVCVSIFR